MMYQYMMSYKGIGFEIDQCKSTLEYMGDFTKHDELNEARLYVLTKLIRLKAIYSDLYTLIANVGINEATGNKAPP